MKEKVLHWSIFILLSLIWGSSFVLMKSGMQVFSAYEVASLRMLSAGIALLPFAVNSFKQIPSAKIPWIITTGLVGSFIPAYLFCVAETKIDSSLAGILNALTPIFTILVGMLFYKLKVGTMKALGLIIGFAGLVLLFVTRGNISFNYLSYSALILLATLFYGINVNLVGHHLKEQSSITIASLAFVSFIVPSLIILWFTGFFQHSIYQQHFATSIAASVSLGLFGTALASVLYYMLIKRAGGFFASMVTYGIPFVAVGWGLYSGETITWKQVTCLCIILLGVYMTSLKMRTKSGSK